MEVPHFLEGSNKILAVTITILQRYLGLFSFALLHVYVRGLDAKHIKSILLVLR